jgi:hypothetical protein
MPERDLLEDTKWIFGKWVRDELIKKSVNTYNSLPSDAKVGDVYKILNADPDNNINAGDLVIWTGDTWEKFNGVFQTGSLTEEELTSLKTGIGIGITRIPAEDYIRASLHQYLSYNENITINAVPIYHLDVNQLIYVENNESDIQGNYIIDSISYPLNFDGLMTINARKMMTMV